MIIEGGGHSPLGSIVGMGADHVLGFEVVTSDGQFVTANKDQTPDLFWALRGGGGGTFSIVTSVIFRVHKDVPVSAALWSFNNSAPNVTTDLFKAGLRAWYEQFPRGGDTGIYAYFSIYSIDGAMSFTMDPYFVPNKTLSEAQAVLQPWLDNMTAIGLPVTPTWTTDSGLYAAYEDL
jgi:hypothetical protein